ncbi:MAG: MATE family efflux transporter [Firmicutes bacterium]|nr:MATE family efflux transporter [Bacillota bacterium]
MNKSEIKKRKMIEGPIAKQLIIFALPLLMANLLQQLLNTTDAIIVGNLIGPYPLTGVTQAGRVIWVLNSLFMGIGVGAGVVISHFYGAKDKENYSKAIHTTIVMGAVLGLIVTGVGIVTTRPLLNMMGLGPDSVLYQYAYDYLMVYFIGVIFVFIFNMGAGILRAVGDSVTPLILLFVAVTLNIGLTILFLQVFNFGVVGLAVSTIISQAVATVLVLLKLFLTKNDYKMSIKKLRIDKKIFIKILRIGIPVGLNTSIIASAHIFMQAYTNAFDIPYYPHAPHGTGVAVYGKIDGFVYMPMMAMSLALTTFVGQNIGADREDRAKKAIKITFLISLIMTLMLGVAVFFSGQHIMSLVAPQMTDEAMAVAIRFMSVVVFAYPVLMFNDTISGALRGAGKALVPSIILVACMFGVRLLFLFFAIDLGGMDILAVFLTFPIAWGVSSICMFVYYLKSGLKKKEKADGEEQCLRTELVDKALAEVSLLPRQIGLETTLEGKREEVIKEEKMESNDLKIINDENSLNIME